MQCPVCKKKTEDYHDSSSSDSTDTDSNEEGDEKLPMDTTGNNMVDESLTPENKTGVQNN